MRLRRCAAAAFGLLVLAPALVACGDDSDGIEVGDVVPARNDDQFSDGIASSVILPRGKLEITLGEATKTLSANETRQLEAITAPDGSTFVPLTWQYDAATFGDYADYLSTADTPAIDLVADGASYRLPAPAESGEGSTSFYVLVSGSAKDPSLAVDFDGVKQTVDLTTGDRDTGDAAALYKLKRPKSNPRSCTEGVRYGNKEVVVAPNQFACSVRQVARLPYAGSAWAEPGHTWLAVTIRTSLRRVDVVAPDLKSGAIYYADAVTPEFELGDVKAAEVIEDRVDRACPDVRQGGCTTVYHVIFDLPEGGSTRITAELAYELTLNSVYGGADAEEILKLPVTVRAKTR